MDALALRSDEGRDRLRNSTVSRQIDFDPSVSEWGNPAGVMSSYCLAEYIGLAERTR